MNRYLAFIRRERLYVLLLIFIVLLNVLIMTSPDERAKRQGMSAKQKESFLEKDFFMKRAETERAFRENHYLAVLFGLASLLILAALLLGLVIDAMLVNMRFSGRPLDIRTYRLPKVKWDVWDVCKVVILFLFFGYMIVMIEAAFRRMFPFIRNDNIRMILNSSVLDALTAVFILYFSVGQYKERLASLGLSLKNFSRNVFYGVVGYLAAVPALVGTLVLIAAVLSITKYVPERQPVVDLFLKEESAAVLTYTTLFAAVAGPIIEEFFFRGFMYSALKRYIGVFWSILLTAALFAALHTHLVGFLPIMVLGIALAYIYERTGTLVSSITLHMTHNFTMVLFIFLIKQLRA